MPAGRRESRFREQARGVGYIVLLAAAVCLVALAVISVFVWVMA